MPLTRFSVPPLHAVTRSLAAVAMGREAPDLVLTGARLLSTYTERIHDAREIWIKSGRIAVVKPAGTFKAECLAVLDRVDATGETVVVTKRGRPVADARRPAPIPPVGLRDAGSS